jgi:hypothetical protein
MTYDKPGPYFKVLHQDADGYLLSAVPNLEHRLPYYRSVETVPFIGKLFIFGHINDVLAYLDDQDGETFNLVIWSVEAEGITEPLDRLSGDPGEFDLYWSNPEEYLKVYDELATLERVLSVQATPPGTLLAERVTLLQQEDKWKLKKKMEHNLI